MKVRLLGLLRRKKPNKLHLFTMTEEHETGTNHIVKVLHRFRTDLNSYKRLQRTLFIQVDHCTRENKNKYIYWYEETLVSLKIFQNVHVSLLSKDRKHEYFDKPLARTRRD